MPLIALPKGRRLKAQKTPTTDPELFKALYEVAPELPRKGICVLMAQWALETGRGRSCMNYNLGNIKAPLSKDHCYFPTYERLTREQGDDLLLHSTPAHPVKMLRILPSGFMLVRIEPDHPGCRFLAFDTLREGAESYIAHLRTRFSKAWEPVEKGDPVEFAIALKKAHYYTADVGVYAKNMASLWREYIMQPWAQPPWGPDAA